MYMLKWPSHTHAHTQSNFCQKGKKTEEKKQDYFYKSLKEEVTIETIYKSVFCMHECELFFINKKVF